MEKVVARFVHFRALFHSRVEDGNGRLDIFGQFSSKQSHRYLVSSWLCWLPYPGFRVNVSPIFRHFRAELVRSCEVEE
jgi:hypothetical protein